MSANTAPPHTGGNWWAAMSPAELRDHLQPARAANFRTGIDTAIRRIRDRAQYLSDEQRQQLRALADSGRAET